MCFYENWDKIYTAKVIICQVKSLINFTKFCTVYIIIENMRFFC